MPSVREMQATAERADGVQVGRKTYFLHERKMTRMATQKLTSLQFNKSARGLKAQTKSDF